MPDVALAVGDRFPPRALPSNGGASFDLSAPERPTVVYFYPKARTSGCTIEARRFNELYASFRDAGVDVVGVSTDAREDLEAWARECGLEFPLLSDSDGALTDRLGLMKDYGEEFGRLPARVTFLLDTDGAIRRVWNVSDVNSHADEVLEAARELLGEEAAAAGTA
ncbi:MAG: peroxiredoxin [Actinomycetota bacterium]|nr:peroxiredoxin [Actinomycetota bacterium]